MPGILGVDPGVTGALALYQPLLSVAANQWVIADLPEHGSNLRYWVQRWSPHVAFLELTFHNKAGSHASFKLGERTGWVLGILESCGVPVVRAQPAAWKRALGLLKKDKGASLELARTLVGPVDELSLKKHHNRAEACLIAYYGSLKYGELV